MAHSVVKVTDSVLNDSLFMLVGEDGTVTPDRETVETFLESRDGPTNLQIMHISKSDGKSIEVSVDNLTYVNTEEPPEEMDEVSRNLLGFQLDHDYTPLTSPSQVLLHDEPEGVDELAETLSILDGTAESGRAKSIAKHNRKPVTNAVNKRTKAVSQFKQPKVVSVRSRPKVGVVIDEEEDDDDFVEGEDDEDDSDYELDEPMRQKPIGKPRRGRKKPDPRKQQQKPKAQTKPKLEQVEQSQPQQIEKKPPKKEKKPTKPIPDDFALFSTPDIIRRVGGKEPTTPTTPDTPKPAKITPGTRSSGSEERSSLGSKSNRGSLDRNRLSFEKPKQESRKSTENKYNTDMVQIQSVADTSEDCGLQPTPTMEEMRAIIMSDDTKTFTTSLALPESENTTSNSEQSTEKGNSFTLEGGGLDLDQSILDNINSDMISEDILYQVAKQLVDNTDLQNVIDKSIVEGNLVLDPAMQNTLMPNEEMQQIGNNQLQKDDETSKGTQIVRPDGRVVVIPPIERPATRSRNKKQDEPVPANVPKVLKPLDDEHVSGNELDSTEEEEEEEEEAEDEDKSEDDPDKLWCICNQPHNNRFMICCDTCEEWYHGKCVNVTKAMGQLMEQEGREWICVYCKDPNLKRPSAAARRIRKASRASTDSSGSLKRTTAATLLTDSVKTVPSSSTKPTNSGLACIVCGKPSRKNSIYCSEACILKHAQGVERVVVFDRRTGKILSGSKAPSAANLEEWLQKHPGFEVLRSTSKNISPGKSHLTQSKLKLVKNKENDGVSLALQKKGVNVGILSHLPKHQHQQQLGKAPIKAQITTLKMMKKSIPTNLHQSKLQVHVKNPSSTPSTSASASSTPVRMKVQPSLKSPPPKDRPMPQKTPKARQAETLAVQPKQENIRDNIVKTLSEQLLNRLKNVNDLSLTEEEVNNISMEIESQLYKCFGDTGQKYKNKYRSLIFNIKDPKNQTLWRRICEKAVNPYQLVRLSPDDLASQELALWREREAKHQLDMIKKSELELLNCNRQYVFKTHKGEQVLEDGITTEAIDSTEVIATLGADSTSVDADEANQDGRDKEKKGSTKHSRKDKDRDKKSSRERDSSKDGRRSREHEKRKRSRSKERSDSRHTEKKRAKSRERDRHKRSSHKSSRHKKEPNETEKLDKKSKEILEQLVDKQIVPPLEDRLWKHVQQEDMITAPAAESDSDHEPTSTVTIPTPPRSIESTEESQTNTSTTEEPVRKEVPVVNEPVKDLQETSRSPPPTKASEFVWKGSINMVDVAQISISAHEVSGDCNGLGDELPPNLDIVGRISPETVWDYIGKMKCSNSKVISLIRLSATNVEEKMPYIALYSYLSSRNRLGVVKSTNKAVKDFYILPLAVQKPIPQALLPINGPGFEEHRPPLLLGIIVRDKRKRPHGVDQPVPHVTKKVKVEIDIAPQPPPEVPTATLPLPPARSYTPPPNRDPRLKAAPYVPPPPPVQIPSLVAAPSPAAVPLELNKPNEQVVDEDDMNEPYSPGDSDPDSAPIAEMGPSRLNADDLSTLLTGTVRTSSFLESGLKTQTFEPFSNKFDTIPGLDDPSTLPSSSQELARKMAELDQRIAMQKAEIDNMSQDIVSTAAASAELGTNALADIALPSNLQQILDSIKTIGVATSTDSQDSQCSNPVESVANQSAASTDLTIPLLLPKLNSRTHPPPTLPTTDTIPLKIPTKSKKRLPPVAPKISEPEKPPTSGGVLSSLSEEDLIRKAAEMLGETSEASPKRGKDEFAGPKKGKEEFAAYAPAVPPPFMFNTPPPQMVPPPVTKKQLDLPPVPGLEDET